MYSNNNQRNQRNQRNQNQYRNQRNHNNACHRQIERNNQRQRNHNNPHACFNDQMMQQYVTQQRQIQQQQATIFQLYNLQLLNQYNELEREHESRKQLRDFRNLLTQNERNMWILSLNNNAGWC